MTNSNSRTSARGGFILPIDDIDDVATARAAASEDDKAPTLVARGVASAIAQDFVAKARDYGREHGYKSDSEAFSAYASTAEGRAAYAIYRNCILGRRRSTGGQAAAADAGTDETGTRMHDPNRDHAFTKAVVNLGIKERIAPMVAAAKVKADQPDLHAAYLKDCEDSGTHPIFRLAD